MADRPLLIRNAHLVDPSQGVDGRASLLISGGRVEAVHRGSGETGVPVGAETIDANGLHCFPGLVDARVHTGEPGSEHRETIASASRAAAAGGITSFIMMPDTNPKIDEVSLVEHVRRTASETAIVRIHPAAAITRGFAGQELTEFGLLQRAGAVMLTDGKDWLRNALTLRRALTYARDFGMVIAQETNDPDLAANGVMNEGLTASMLGLPGIPREAEIVALERDLRIAALARGRYHAAKISTSDSATAVLRAKDGHEGITAGTSINHLTLNENDIGRYRTFFRLSPPLRAEEDRQATIEALRTGAIDIIVSSHDPQDVDTKRHPFAEAADGAIGLETMLAAALRLYHNGEVPLARLIDAMSTRPARIFGLEAGTLQPGARADLCLADLDEPWVLDESQIRSQSKNTPFEGARLSGRVLQTMVGGRIIFSS
ncbi:MAG: dihydroorotase [Nitratireductor sp.]|nr:dihydroorotase [Nitratireductor sp.]